MHAQQFDLAAAAAAEMLREGFHPAFPSGSLEQIAAIRSTVKSHPQNGTDLRGLAWSSIDNDTSRDLDQLEMAEKVAEGILVRVAIADVSQSVAKDTPIDKHAAD